MTLTVNTIGDNPQQPGIYAEAYIPDQLIAGNAKLVTSTVTFVSGQVLARGSVVGLITASGKYALSLSASSDGSQSPVAIVADAVDASGGDVVGGVYLSGEFNENALTLGTGITLAAARAALRPLAIWIKSAVVASDPT